MSNIFDLQKREQTITFVLEKRAIKKTPVLRVGVAFDVTGSAHGLYTSGVMQKTVDRLVPVAMRFDDNGEMDAWSFDTGFDRLGSISKMDYEDFVDRQIMANDDISKWGSTNYAPVLADMRDFYFKGAAPAKKGFLGGLFGNKPAAAPAAESGQVPAMALLITDGANFDRPATERLLADSVNVPVYWQMVGVGNPSEFGFIEAMADKYPHVGFVHLTSLEISDEKLYDALLSEELCEWMKKY